MSMSTEKVRKSRLYIIMDLFAFFELKEQDRLDYIITYCGNASLKRAKNSDIKDLSDFLTEKKAKLFSELKASAIKAGVSQKSNKDLMDAWEVDKLLQECYGVTLRDAKASHIRKIIHLFNTGELS